MNGFEGGEGRRLDTWKEIASFFGKDERTVKRWEKQRGLPVRRLPGARAGVYAYAEDLERWLRSGNASASEEEAEVWNAVPPTAPVTARVEKSAWKSMIVAGAVLGLLMVAIGLADLAELKGSRRSLNRASQEAHELYLRGRYLWNKRTPDSLEQAVDQFTQAIVRDPDYAPAYAGLADCYNLLREYTAMPAAEAYPRAIAAARRAVALDDSLAEAHTALAFAEFWWNWNATTAEHEFRRALALQPASAQAHHWYATFLLTAGRPQQALTEITRAQELNPDSTSVLCDKAFILFYAGYREQSLALLRQMEKENPQFLSPHNYLASIWLDRHQDREFLAESGRAAALAHDADRAAAVSAAEAAFEQGGERAMLRSMLRVREQQYADGRGAAYEIARLHSLLGENGKAVDYLRRSYQEHETNLLGIRADEALAGLRSDSSYQKLVSEIVRRW